MNCGPKCRPGNCVCPGRLPIKFADPADESRFTVGMAIWTPDGVNFYRGEPPPPPPGSPTITVTAVDYKRGIVVVE